MRAGTARAGAAAGVALAGADAGAALADEDWVLVGEALTGAAFRYGDGLAAAARAGAGSARKALDSNVTVAAIGAVSAPLLLSTPALLKAPAPTRVAVGEWRMALAAPPFDVVADTGEEDSVDAASAPRLWTGSPPVASIPVDTASTALERLTTASRPVTASPASERKVAGRWGLR